MTGDPTVPPVDPPPIPRGRVPSRVLVHTGDGKGKTSAAMGIVMRGAARGWRVAVFQFVKDDRWRTGEESSARALGVDWWSGGDGFTWDSEDLDRTERVARAAWDAARAAIAAGEHHLVVLDEVTYPINWGWIAIDDMVAAIQGRPSHVNVVATGRDAPSALCDIADTVTEMASVKHAFDEGIGATRGIEF